MAASVATPPRHAMSGGDPTVVEAAVTFAGRGLPVLGVGPDKRPRVLTTALVSGARRPTWEPRQRAAPDVELVRREVDRPQVTGYGVVLGAVAGRALGAAALGVLDLEQATAAGRFMDAAGLHAADTALARSGGGGRHLWLASGAPVVTRPIFDAASGEHLGEIRGEGSYIIGPPSLHASGARYRWLSPPHTRPMALPDVMAWLDPLLLQLGWTLTAPRAQSSDAGGGGIAGLLATDCPEGSRHATLIRLLGWMRDAMARPEAEALALLWNASRCRPPQDAREVVDQVRDAYARFPEPPRLLLKVRAEPSDEGEDDAVPPIPPIPAECLRGWVGDYVRLMAPTTEAPDAYHVAGALVAAGMILGRSCFNRYGRRVYPNIYAILVGASGASRKDTAIARAVEAMEPPDARIVPFRTLDTVASAEGLIERLGTGKGTLLALSEMSILLRNARREGTANIIPYLTKLFDCPDVVEVPSRKNPVRAERPFLSILGGTTPEWFAADITEDDIRGGFAGRFLYLTGVPKPPIANPPAAAPMELHRLRSHAYDVAQAFQQSGTVEFGLTEAARAWWERFYLAEFAREYVGEFGVLSQRVPLYVRKVALLYAALDGAAAIDQEHLEAGAALVRASQEFMRVAHGTWGASQDAKLQSRMLALVHDRGCRLSKRALHMALSGRVRGSDFRTGLGILLGFGRLTMLDDGTIGCLHRARRNGHADA